MRDFVDFNNNDSNLRVSKDLNDSDVPNISNDVNNSPSANAISNEENNIEEPPRVIRSHRLRKKAKVESNYWVHRIDCEKIEDLSKTLVLAAKPRHSKPIMDVQKDDRILLLTKPNKSSRIQFFAYTQVDEVFEDEDTLYGGYYKSKKKLKLKGIKYFSKPVATKDVVPKLESVEKNNASKYFKSGSYLKISENDFKIIRRRVFLLKEFPEYLDEFTRSLEDFIIETINSLDSFLASYGKYTSDKKFLQLLKDTLEYYGIEKELSELGEICSKLQSMEDSSDDKFKQDSIHSSIFDGLEKNKGKDSSKSAKLGESRVEDASKSTNIEDASKSSVFEQSKLEDSSKSFKIEESKVSNSIKVLKTKETDIDDSQKEVSKLSPSEGKDSLDYWTRKHDSKSESENSTDVESKQRKIIKAKNPKFWIHRVDCNVINDINDNKVLGAKAQRSKLIKDLNPNDRILLLTKLNNSSKIEFFAYTQIEDTYFDNKILYDYYESDRKLRLKGIKYFSRPIATNDLAYELDFVKNKEKSANDFKAEYKNISKKDFARIYSSSELVENYPDYLVEYDVTLKDFILYTIKSLVELLKIYSNQKIILIKKFIRILKEVLSAYGIYKTNAELESFYSRYIHELKIRHIPSRNPEEFVPLYMSSGKTRNYSFIGLA